MTEPGDRLREAAKQYQDEWLGYLDPDDQPLETGVFGLVVDLLETSARLADRGQHNRMVWFGERFADLVLPVDEAAETPS
jgi:hypothetical protein